MTKIRIVKYATNTALLAVLAAAGIGAYQLGTSKPEEISRKNRNLWKWNKVQRKNPW